MSVPFFGMQGRATQPSLPEREMGQLFKEHQIALSAAATADFKALLNEACTAHALHFIRS